MALTIETGARVAGADSYAPVADLVAYAAKYGFTIPAGEPEREVLLRRAALQMDVLKWKGTRISAVQALAWPRRNVLVDFEFLPLALIPAGLIFGQLALACEIYRDDITEPEQKSGAVIEETVGELTVKYAAANSTTRTLRAAPERQSRAQFADYLQTRGLFAVRS